MSCSTFLAEPAKIRDCAASKIAESFAAAGPECQRRLGALALVAMLTSTPPRAARTCGGAYLPLFQYRRILPISDRTEPSRRSQLAEQFVSHARQMAYAATPSCDAKLKVWEPGRRPGGRRSGMLATRGRCVRRLLRVNFDGRRAAIKTNSPPRADKWSGPISRGRRYAHPHRREAPPRSPS